MFFGTDRKDEATVVAMLASAIRRDISFGVLRPDQKLKIDALRQAYGGSTHSMRETLRMLTAEGMVEATSQRGFRVTSASEEDRQDILLMRLEVERLGLARSMERGGVAWEGRLVAAQHALSRADAAVQADPGDLTALQWDEACRSFAGTLVEACASPRLVDVAARFFNQSRRFRLARLREGGIDFAARGARRDALCRAVLDGDVPRALTLQAEDIRADMGA